MKLTNTQNLPAPIVAAIQNDPYEKGDADYSVTELLNPPRQTWLKRRHDAEISEDASERMWSLLGQAVHSILDRAQVDNAIHEERLTVEVDGGARVVKVSGKADLYEGHGTLSDYKVTSAWTRVYGSRIAEWEEQLNLYAHLFRAHGFEVNKLQIVCIYRDWSATNALKSKDYPQAQVEVISIKLWPAQDAQDHLEGRVQDLEAERETPDAALPECKPDEMWEKPTTWAAMKQGRKTALKLFDNRVEADALAANTSGGYVEMRPGKRTRCEDYCPAAPFCSQFQAYKAANPAPAEAAD